jgi:basic amino acid/polyamine antiporter, APA family
MASISSADVQNDRQSWFAGPHLNKTRGVRLVRGLTFFPAMALNMVDMIGVGPFTTLPLMVVAMGGPKAIYGWIAGAILAMADGLIWAELGAAMPRAGGSYQYLQEIYGRQKLGPLLSFLFVFQLVLTAPVSMATGCIGLAGYGAYLFPKLRIVFWQSALHFNFLGPVSLKLEVSGATLVGCAAALLATALVYRRIAAIGRISQLFWTGVLGAVGLVIVMGVTHFHRNLAFPVGWTAAPVAWSGFSTALLIALYDYFGYYNICFLGEEVVDPGRTIPRSMIISIALVAVLYAAMNISVLGILPVRDLAAMGQGTAQNFAFSRAAEAAFGHWAGILMALLITWTAFASVFALLAGYSRIPFAAARDGNFFRFFGSVHPKNHFPARSVLLLGLLACVFCIFQLKDLVNALVVIRVMLLFLVQAVGAVVWRITNKDRPRPFRMWLYPLPVLITLAGFSLVLVDKRGLVQRGLVLAVLGVVAYLGHLYLCSRRQQRA